MTTQLKLKERKLGRILSLPSGPELLDLLVQYLKTFSSFNLKSKMVYLLLMESLKIFPSPSKTAKLRKTTLSPALRTTEIPKLK
jgi:hypothetical protein